MLYLLPYSLISLAIAESNVKQAIAACREEHGNVLKNRQQMQTVRESLDEGYCDISGRVSDLNYIGKLYCWQPFYLDCEN